MFKKLKETKEQISKRGDLSVVADGMLVKGDLISEGELYFNGVVEGSLTARRIILGEHGKVAGSIKADVIEIYGSVVGEIVARIVKLGTSAQVKGNITQENITIEAGANLDGHCRRVDDPIEGESPTEDLLLVDKTKERE